MEAWQDHAGNGTSLRNLPLPSVPERLERRGANCMEISPEQLQWSREEAMTTTSSGTDRDQEH